MNEFPKYTACLSGSRCWPSYRSRTQTQTLLSRSSELGVGKGTPLGVSVAAGLQPGQRSGTAALLEGPRRGRRGWPPGSQTLGAPERCSPSQTLRNEESARQQGCGWAGCVPGRRNSSAPSQRDPAPGRGLICQNAEPRMPGEVGGRVCGPWERRF